jgi:hypothetical protein
LSRSRLVLQHFELAAHARDLAAQGLDLRGKLHQRAPVRDPGEALLDQLGGRIDLLAQILDPARATLSSKQRVRWHGKRACREQAAARATGSSSFALVEDVAAPVLRPGLLVMPFGARLFLAQADRLDLLLARARASACASRRPSALPRPMLYSRLPRSSVLPWMSILRPGLSRRNWRAPRPVLVLVLHVVLVEVVENRAARQGLPAVGAAIAPSARGQVHARDIARPDAASRAPAARCGPRRPRETAPIPAARAGRQDCGE